jgi:hypothetical protein
MPASPSVRSKKGPGRSASSLVRVLGRSEAGLSGARPFFWAAIRATWLCAGVGLEAAASADRLPFHRERHAPPQAICLQIGDGGRAQRGLDRANRRRSRQGTDGCFIAIGFIPYGLEIRHRLNDPPISPRLSAIKHNLHAGACQHCPAASRAALATKMSWSRKIFDPGKLGMIGSHAPAPVRRSASVTPAGLSAVSRIPPCWDFRGNKVEAENRPDSQ